MSSIRLDYGNMLVGSLDGRGVDLDRDADLLRGRFDSALEGFRERHDAGELGFLDLPSSSASHEAVWRTADELGRNCDNLVVLGIGGSGLGCTMLRDALLGLSWNRRNEKDRGSSPRLFVLDNPDPVTVHELLDSLDLRKTLFNVISKSGSTAETMALYLVARSLVASVVGDDAIAEHFVFTTDASGGALREIAETEGIPTLPVPGNVGGRFSVLSPVGLFPAAVCGIDTSAVLEGAARMKERCVVASLWDNPAAVFATLLHTWHTDLQTPIHVLMPYSDRLRSLALWFQQLWAESLGKECSSTGEVVETGPTPLPAVGATDQHSQVQLFMEGPRDKVVVFVAVEERAARVEIPRLHDGIDALAYLGGHELGSLLDAERLATAEALRLRGRPNMTLCVNRLSADTLGELVMLFEVATVLAGGMYGVDPLDQPGVELGKRLTYGLLGRAGHDAPDLRHADPRWSV